MRFVQGIMVGLCFVSAASADGLDVVQGLADVLAAEQFCGLVYDAAAIEAFVGEHVEPDDLDFTSTLSGLIFMAEQNQAGMTPSVAAAHCAQIRRLAAAYHFTEH